RCRGGEALHAGRASPAAELALVVRAGALRARRRQRPAGPRVPAAGRSARPAGAREGLPLVADDDYDARPAERGWAQAVERSDDLDAEVARKAERLAAEPGPEIGRAHV